MKSIDHVTTENSFVAIKKERNAIQVAWGYNLLSKQEDDGKFSCYIPGFEIYFSASTRDEIIPKSKMLTKIFFDHFFKHTKSPKSFALEMHKKGFRAPKDAFVIRELMNNRFLDVKFKSEKDTVPEGFEGGDSEAMKSEMEVAV